MELEDYEFIKQLNKGNFGSIHIVKRKEEEKAEDDKEFVMKKQSIHDFAMNEVAIMSKLNHPNVVTFYNSWEEDGHSYILMEYVSGKSLHKLFETAYYNNEMPMTENEALDFFAQITLGVNHMHQRDVLHRDLKPENVLFTVPQNIVKIVDFGISSDVSAELQVSVLNPNDYSAPEHWSDEDLPHTFESDIWSIGALLYESVTNIQPKDLKDDLDALEDLPDTIKSILKRVLIVSPDERPDSNEILHYSELQPALKSYCESLESPDKEIVEEQLKDVVNEVDE